MDSSRVLKLVLQYVAENYPNALKALEDEANVTYDSGMSLNLAINPFFVVGFVINDDLL